MPIIPPTVLEKLYVKESLRLEDQGFAFDLKNLIAPATITGVTSLDVDGTARDDATVTIVPPSGNPRPAERISGSTPLEFPVGSVVSVHVTSETLEAGNHEITLQVEVKEIGPLKIPVSDTIRA